jgi:beta-glucan synthesis-associated protein KRE6
VAGLAHNASPSHHQVFSDEFEQDGRTFHDGKDPRWTAIKKNDCKQDCRWRCFFPKLHETAVSIIFAPVFHASSKDTNLALHFYHDDNAITTNGVLNITTEIKTNVYKAFNEKTKKFYADAKHVQTGMLQGWNKFCHIGGIVEFSAKLPGKPEDGGLWPACKSLCFLVCEEPGVVAFKSEDLMHVAVVWMLGNLGRATFVGSSNFMWPFSYNLCDPKKRQTQAINACDKLNHYGMAPNTGRGSPEIDIIEAMQGNMKEKLPSTHIMRPYQSTSLQVGFVIGICLLLTFATSYAQPLAIL